jgi:RNA polymerase sigma-70 factor (ECF subfamily)
MTLDTTALVRQAQSGSLPAFEQLFRAHERRIYSLALRMVGDVAAAEDLTQDTFVRAWENLRSLRHEGAFAGWLRRIALNLIWDYIRRRSPTEELRDDVADDLPDQGAPAEQVLAESSLAKKVQAAVMGLPEHQRVVVAMFYWEDMPVNEIARALGIARGTVISRLARGREALRRRLGPTLEVST